MLSLPTKLAALYRLGVTTGFCLVAVAAGVLGYRLVRNQIAGDIYRERLQTLSTDYEHLRSRYNEAVRRTAVTELLVKDNRLSVNVITADGVEKSIDTPFDPSKEVYVDYVVIQGRLWIRRVFDSATAPGKGLVIEPPLKDVDWTDPRLAVGKAVYRSLSDGRWIVTVTGDGSLGLSRLDHDDPIKLKPLAEIREYPELQKQVSAEVDAIGMGEVWKELTGKR